MTGVEGKFEWWEKNLGQQQHVVVQLAADGTYKLHIDGHEFRKDMTREFWLTGRRSRSLATRLRAAISAFRKA